MPLIRIIIFTIVLLFSPVTFSLAKQTPAAVVSPGIVINVPSRTLELYSADQLFKEYPVAVGKSTTPTPLGNYSIISKEVNPDWYPPDQNGRVVPSGPENPLGYRWLGIWSTTYGIHGTNAPWSIGSAVSNGCIRMYEPDVEELFELVDYGTPVKVTYDRVKVKIDNQGQAVVRIYPDIYHLGSIVTNADIRRQLGLYHLNGFVSNEILPKVIDESTDKAAVVARLFSVVINDQTLREKGIAVEGTRYIPISSIAEYLRMSITWDDPTKTIQVGTRSFPGVINGKIIYVSEANAEVLLDGYSVWHSEDNCWTFSKLAVHLNNKQIDLKVKKIDGALAVSAGALADILGYSSNWDLSKQIFLLIGKKEMRQVPIKLIGSEPYVYLTNINEFYNVHVYWNEPANTIELTYPAP
ncbi:MAG TPA: L,D-transpeptidase family protein [Methylomusa anaerophila]|uniref:Putative L,D-transpeptidase YkuD n=1 Tax=Methylomusa anaerophila TaxID=1930071 RepID=A0A348AQP4_9FIRM|nr:L,D-transpeptidase family protein [Methylomusa anaerophila]BBB93392.1 putative L,D-transpeptidase YkuD [Methylomusa anaerophila]HML90340.1 L,D-transpeptidase family protein [Methylomusa anaerophila]